MYCILQICQDGCKVRYICHSMDELYKRYNELQSRTGYDYIVIDKDNHIIDFKKKKSFVYRLFTTILYFVVLYYIYEAFKKKE